MPLFDPQRADLEQALTSLWGAQSARALTQDLVAAAGNQLQNGDDHGALWSLYSAMSSQWWVNMYEQDVLYIFGAILELIGEPESHLTGWLREALEPLSAVPAT